MKTHPLLIKSVVIFEVLLAGCLALAGSPGPVQSVGGPSLGEVARQAKADRAQEHLSNVPLFTNDNLPEAGLGVIGSSNPIGRQPASERFAQQQSANKQKLEQLRYDLSQAQQKLEVHQRELEVLEKQLSQNNMQYYPNPNQTMLQEYSRQDINNLTEKTFQKKQQIAEDQQAVDNLQRELKNAEASWGWLGAPRANNNQPPAPPPIAAAPGSPAYWRAELARAQEQLDSAKEREKLAEDELNLLNVQQARTLDPNAQADLASAISAKQEEVTAAQNAVGQAQEKLEDIEKQMKAATRN